MSVDGGEPPLRGIAFYDAHCPLCLRLLRRAGSPFWRRGFIFLPLQEACASDEAPFPPEAFRHEMKLLLHRSYLLGVYAFTFWKGLVV